MANPLAMILTGALMLRSLGLEEAGSSIEDAVAVVIKEGMVTEELGGNLGTNAVAKAVINALKSA